MEERDQYLSDNFDYIVNIFGPNIILKIILDVDYKINNNFYPKTYLKLYNLIIKGDIYQNLKYYLNFNYTNVDLLFKVQNYEEISQIMTIIKSRKHSFQLNLNNDDHHKMNNFLDLINATFYFNDGCSLSSFFDQSDELDIFFDILSRYATITDTDHFFHFIKFQDLTDFDHIKRLNSINYNFSYLVTISDIEIFKYLYHQTNFNQTFESQKGQVLNYIWQRIETFQYIVENYLYQDIQHLIQTFDLTQVIDDNDNDLADVKLLKYLNELGYDFNTENCYDYISYTVIDIKNIRFLATLDLNQKILQYLYYILLKYRDTDKFDDNLTLNLYHRITIFSEEFSIFKVLPMKYFIQIMDKSSNPNIIFNWAYSLEQLNYVFNHYELKDIDSSLFIKAIVKSFKYNHLESNYLSQVEIGYKYGLTITNDQLFLIYDECFQQRWSKHTFKYEEFQGIFKIILVD